MITVSHITKSFEEIKAVDDLSFEIRNDEVIGLLGPNGAGKSTTMRMLTGFLMPDSGSIKIENIEVTAIPIAAQKQIGYLPENNPLYKDMLVSELLAFSADLKHIIPEELDETLEFVINAVNINDVYYRPIYELSKGYKQRVGIAVALLHKPKILILDEPTEGLDPNQRQEIRSLIKNLAKNHTIVISTHVMQEVEAMCDRLLIINKGKLVADGKPKQLVRKTHGLINIEFDIEGQNVEKNLKLIKNAHVTINKTKHDRVSGILICKSILPVQPEIAKLSLKHKWVIWELFEQQKELEDVFQELTTS